MKALNRCGMFKPIFTLKPLRGVFEVEKIHAAIAPRRCFNARIHVGHFLGWTGPPGRVPASLSAGRAWQATTRRGL
jgi:hypothetical protein